ncbi:MAG: ATP cone domain-containing protein, partial [Butyrivibrio sp.]|nr:ATP cone domain-containing protein [Butyrivibrio sp.]
MKIIKRSGAEVAFDLEKISAAIRKANDSVEGMEKISEEEIDEIAKVVAEHCVEMKRSPSVEEIQDMVENQLMKHDAYSMARNYITYRYRRALVRKSNSTDQQILSLLECNNEEVKQENSNKNPTVNSVQRDYMAGEVSKDITKRFLLPPDIVEAHEQGVIHFHDADYFAQHMHNCCLVNLEDMLQNGTVISETMIDTPKSFSTACNVATQCIAQIASSQYGGQSISLAHLAPFVQVSREKLRRVVREEMQAAGIAVTEEQVNTIAEVRVREEINRGVQMIQYQVITLMTTNGQAPFVTVFMYIDEAPEGQTRDDLAMVIEEMLNQRIRGVKNEKGVYITPAFPKLIYVLEEDNIHEDSKYWYLTKLAAKCTAKRMVPDYISEKIMKKLKDGNCYTCMGCRSFLTVYHDENDKPKFYGRFNQGVVTLNLVDIACSSGKDVDAFWKIFDERLELCKRALMCRHDRLKGTPSDV